MSSKFSTWRKQIQFPKLYDLLGMEDNGKPVILMLYLNCAYTYSYLPVILLRPEVWDASLKVEL
jgi:hypothetical protein